MGNVNQRYFYLSRTGTQPHFRKDCRTLVGRAEMERVVRLQLDYEYTDTGIKVWGEGLTANSAGRLWRYACVVCAPPMGDAA